MFGALARRMGANDRSIGRFLLGAMALGFVLLLAAGVAATFAMRASQRHATWVAHSYQVEVAVERAQLLVEQAEATRRGYLLSHEQLYLDTYRGFDRDIDGAVDRIVGLTRDNPRQQAAIAPYRAVIGGLRTAREHTIALVQAGDSERATRDFIAEAGFTRLRLLRDAATRMEREEQRLLAIRDAQQRQSERNFYVTVAVAGALLTLLIALTAATVLRFTRDLSASATQLRGLNETLEDKVVERTSDLTLANEEIQRFAYIVSHDLRSPLVNVMGFTAELAAASAPLAALVDRAEAEAPAILTEEARVAAREDLPEAIRFIRTSTAKMDRLINAILKLSREGRRVIAPESFDPADVADGAVAALAHVIDERGVTVTVRRPMPRLVSDRLAVEQILSNLLENAVKYLDPSRPGEIALSGASRQGRVVLSVADNGRGIAPGDHQRVFDLFRRSGPQDQPGEGIGLAHVRALAYRLGGTIDLQSRLGEGSTFSLVLPPVIQPEA